MGWTSCYRWYSPTVLRKEYEQGIARSGKIKTFGWCGSFLKCLHVPTNRPFVVDVMVRFFGKHEGYGYKDIGALPAPMIPTSPPLAGCVVSLPSATSIRSPSSTTGCCTVRARLATTRCSRRSLQERY